MDRHPLLVAARAWASADPDPLMRARLEEQVAAGEAGDPASLADLADAFSGPLAFGTAGLRGPVGPGPNRMNRVVVARAAAGLAAYLREQGLEGPVVIGYDARHDSETFARESAEVIAGAGLRALLLPRALPTPVLAHAVLRLGAAAGVMVTASHNPAGDNGYKVYLGDGSQIVPPHDAGIAARMAEVGVVGDLPRAEPELLDNGALSSWLAGTSALVDTCGPRQLAIAYTPLHGVGADPTLRLLRLAGFAAPAVVAEQAEPDPDFPTVAFPNPEEDGAMDAVIALAVQTGADLALAHDPDADRCAVAIPPPPGAGHGSGPGWRVLRGDETGWLLADFLLRTGVRGTFATTLVSSSLLQRLAAAHDQPYVETLTGFKWLGRVPGLAFGYEEALGYCVDPARVRDKDGVSALLRIVEMAALLKASGRTLGDRLDEIAAAYGVHETGQLSHRVSDPRVLVAMMARLRATPPTVLGGLAVERHDDLADGVDGLPPTEGLRWWLGPGTGSGSARVVVRPSGTEPKLKLYLEVVVDVEEGSGTDGVPAARIAAAGRLDAIAEDLRELLHG